MRTIEVNEELLKYTQEFFEIYDFSFLMFTAAVVQTTIMVGVLMIPYEPIQTVIKVNITFYLLAFQLIAAFFFLTKDTFNLGFFRITDEVKMQLFMGFKAFCLTFLMFQYFDTDLLFSFNINKVHRDLNIKINQGMEPFGMK